MTAQTPREAAMQPTLLFVDDEPHILKSIRRLMMDQDFQCLFANSGAEALEVLQAHSVDVIISDMRMPKMTGAELLEQVAQQWPETVRIILSGHSDSESIMAAINQGRIWGYINKPWDDEQLIQTLTHAIFTQQIIAERALLRRTVDAYESQRRESFMGFVGNSIPMQFIYSAIEKAAPSNASVFITGCSGAGKEVAAEAIHRLSKRQDKPFMAINCAAIPSELMESEIFGHVKGAFSGAVSNRDGAATLADGGTLFLDELAEMDMSLQAKLLRFIQTGTFQKVGSSKIEQVDIRFICATNRDPLQAVTDKKLREDLFYRLNVIALHLPDLNERDGDALQLAEHFLQHYAEKEDKIIVGFAEEAKTFINGYSWPGNVRQLQNALHSAVVMSSGPLISIDDIQHSLGHALQQADTAVSNKPPTMPATPLSSTTNTIRPLHEVEKIAIENAIHLCDDNVVKAAAELQVSPSTLYRKIQSWK